MISRDDNRTFGLMLAVALFLAVYFFLRYLGEIVFFFFLGVVLAYLLNPIIVRLEARGFRRDRVVIGFYVLSSLVMVLAARILIPIVVSLVTSQQSRVADFADLIDTFPADIEKNWLSRLPVGAEQAIAGVEAGKRWVEHSLSGLPAALVGLSPKLLNLLLLPLLTYFPLVEGSRWMNNLIQTCPSRHVEKVVSLVSQIDAVLGSYLRGLMLDSFCFAVVTYLALSLLGLDYALELAVLAGLVNVIPYLGPFTIALLSSGMAYMQFHEISVVYRVIGTILVIKFIDDWVLQPLIMQSAVEVHPLLGLFAIAAGGQLFGFFGLIFAVPATAALKAAAQVFYDWYVAETGARAAQFSHHSAHIPTI